MSIFIKDQGIWKEVGGGGFPALEMGGAFGGGFFIGMSYAADGIYAMIIAAKSAEQSLQWKTSNTSTSGTSSTADGWANTNAMNNSSHPAAQHCRAYRGGGFTDWYLPAKDELNFIWLAIPPNGSGTPAIFRAGAAQAMDSSGTYYWSSTEYSANSAWGQRFSDGGTSTSYGKNGSRLVRPVRRLKL